MFPLLQCNRIKHLNIASDSIPFINLELGRIANHPFHQVDEVKTGDDTRIAEVVAPSGNVNAAYKLRLFRAVLRGGHSGRIEGR